MKYISILLISSLSFAQQTVEYGWEDGGTILGSYGNLSNPQNVGTTAGISPYEGDYMLSVTEDPPSGTPQAFVAWITDLSAGDEVNACFFGYDISPDTKPSLRIWGSWSANDDIASYSGTADGNTAYTDGTGWSEVCHTFSTTQENWEEGKALVVQARLYSEDEPTEYFIDNLSVTAPSSATINIPSLENAIEGCTDPNADNYNPDANIDDDSCEYENSLEYSIAQIQESSTQSGVTDNDCYPSPVLGQLVTTTGIVTAVKPGSPNFFLQDPESDSWSGIYVYDTSINPTIGSELSVTAEVNEYYGATQLLNVGTFENLSTGNSVNSHDIETGELSLLCNLDGEMYEGMLVTVSNVEVEYTDEYNAWYINDGSGTAKIDDYFFDGEWSMPVAGDSFESITGVVHFAYDNYAIYPRFANDIQTDSTLPVADAGMDQSVTPGQQVTLDGGNSYDPDGQIVGYEWSAPEGYSFDFDENDVSISFNAPDGQGEYIFTLTVFDNDGNEDSDQVTVSVMPVLSIYEIQYTEIEAGEFDDSCYPTLYNGEFVTTTGIVTAVKPGSYPNFYIEDPSNDTWSGIYVYDTTVNPSIGDEILITAEAGDFYSQTQLSYVSSFTTLSVGNILQPQAVQTGELGRECNLSGESYEGMLVSIQNAEVVAFDDFGAWIVNDGSGDAMVDDYFFDGDWPSVSVGDVVNVSGVLEFAYGEYKIIPRDQTDFEGGCTANGDVNQDGELNILDIVIIVNSVVGAATIDECIADVNQDGVVNILDVVTTINLILSGRTIDDEASSITITNENSKLLAHADGDIPGIELTIKHEDSVTIELTEDCLLSAMNSKDGISKIVVLYPESELIFSSSGTYEIIDVIAANSAGEIQVDVLGLYCREADRFNISKVYPNPFNPVTRIEFVLAESSQVQATIYNMVGDRLAVIANGNFEAGLNRLEWNASEFSSGVYFLKLESDFGVDTRKLVLMK